MADVTDPNLKSIEKIKQLLSIYQDIFATLPPPQEKMKEQLGELRRLLDSGSVEDLKHYLNNLNNTQTKLVNEVRDLNIAYTKLRNAVK
jgi:hypothetical protein